MYLHRRNFLAGSAAAAGAAAGLPGLALAQELAPLPVVMKGSLTGSMKGRPRVAVGATGISYLVSSKTSASGGWGAQAKLSTMLNGLDEATARKIADEAHADLLSQLAAAGLDVVSASDARAAMQASGVTFTPDNRRSGSANLDGKSGRKWIAVGATEAPMIPGSSGEADNLMAGLKSNKALAKASTELNAVILNPVMWMDYISIKSSGNRVYSNSASIQSSVRLSIPSTQSSFWPAASDARGMWLGARLDMAKTVESPAVIATRELGAGAQPQGLAAMIGEARGDLIHLDIPAWEPAARSAYRGYNAAIVSEVKKFPR